MLGSIPGPGGERRFFKGLFGPLESFFSGGGRVPDET